MNSTLDWCGALLARVGFASLVYGLMESLRLGFGHPLVLFTFLAGVLLALFFFVEARRWTPRLPLEPFARAISPAPIC